MSARPFIVLTDEQRTDAWRQARVGRLTGTGAAAMLAKIKSGEAAARRDLRTRLVVERLTNTSQEDSYVSKEMQRGNDLEMDAIAVYEALTGRTVMPVGFLGHSKLLAGCSPDGAVDDFAGLVEVKVPKSATHLRYFREQRVPLDYIPQITHNLWISGAAWCDFISYDDRMPEPLRLFVKRIHASDVDLAAYELVVRLFLNEVNAELEDVRRLIPAA